MDAGIASTLNRDYARRIAAHMDLLDEKFSNQTAWYWTPFATAFMGETSDRAWLAAAVASCAPGMHADDLAADGDWELLFSEIRTEIQVRRESDSENPRPEAALTAVGSEV